MPPAMFRCSAKPLSGRYLSLTEREEIALLRVQGHSMQEIGCRLGRSASTISRELRRNSATRGGGLEYRATTAQWHAERSARRPKPSKLALNATLRTYVEKRLAGIVVAPSGVPTPGPAVSWNGRRHGQRQDRRWARAWSPEQIARRLPIDFPDNKTMRISHEAIYQALFIQGRGELRRELTACLRTGRVLRVPRARCACRKLDPYVLVMQSTQDRTGEYATNGLDGARNRRVLVQGQVRARLIVVYPVHVMTRKSFGLMTRKLSVTESQRSAQFPGTFSRRKLSVASANWAQVA